MSIVAIDPNAVRSQATEKKRAVGMDDFSAALNAAGPAAASTVALNTGQYQPAAVTQAAISGIAGTPQSFSANSPYYMPYSSTVGTTSLPLPSGGFNPYGSGANYAGGYVGGPAGTVSVNSTGSGVVGTNSTDTLAEQQQLFQQMNDANWQMLVAQVTVNDIGRDYQARSNVLKTKSDTELNAVRNMKA